MTTTQNFAAALALSLLTSAFASAQAERLAPKPDRYELTLEISDDRLRVTGGSPFDPCALLLGVAETRHVLPGGAVLSVLPLLVTDRARFDAQGIFELSLAQEAANQFHAGFLFVQAITIVQDSNRFATSNVEVISLDRTSPLALVQKTYPTDSSDEAKATDTMGTGEVWKSRGTQSLDNTAKPIGPKPLDRDGEDTDM